MNIEDILLNSFFGILLLIVVFLLGQWQLKRKPLETRQYYDRKSCYWIVYHTETGWVISRNKRKVEGIKILSPKNR